MNPQMTLVLTALVCVVCVVFCGAAPSAHTMSVKLLPFLSTPSLTLERPAATGGAPHHPPTKVTIYPTAPTPSALTRRSKNDASDWAHQVTCRCPWSLNSGHCLVATPSRWGQYQRPKGFCVPKIDLQFRAHSIIFFREETFSDMGAPVTPVWGPWTMACLQFTLWATAFLLRAPP